jgi:hypothetical protein
LKIKQKQKGEATEMEDAERLVAEIEMLKVVLYLAMRSKRRRKDAYRALLLLPSWRCC